MQSNTPACTFCGGTDFTHRIDCAHGIAGTFMVGSERFKCNKCGRSVYAREGEQLGFKFVLDGSKDKRNAE